ncbi:MAG: hypothetical protein ACE15D_09545 [Candidatus Eisenbacteria bacterium]|nr:hypothetical protein [Candidatus Eisenbacteria bacterium]
MKYRPVPGIARSVRAPLATLAVFGIALLFAGLGCSDDNETKPPEELAPPTSLDAVNGDGEIVLTWDASPDEGATNFDGYEIYRGTQSLASLTLQQLEQYRIGHAGETVHTYTDNVTNGTLYYYHVRSINTADDQSEASNEITAAGRAEGTDVIIEEFEAEGASGFNFASGDPVALDQSNEDRFTLTDIYLGTGASDDDPGSPLALKSPHLLSRLNAEWDSRIAQIKLLGNGADSWETRTTNDTGMSNQSGVDAVGNVYAIKTPDNHWGKIWVQEIDDANPGSRKITFRYAYQPTAGLAQF